MLWSRKRGSLPHGLACVFFVAVSSVEILVRQVIRRA